MAGHHAHGSRRSEKKKKGSGAPYDPVLSPRTQLEIHAASLGKHPILMPQKMGIKICKSAGSCKEMSESMGKSLDPPHSHLNEVMKTQQFLISDDYTLMKTYLD